jgi:hypothetical protein
MTHQLRKMAMPPKLKVRPLEMAPPPTARMVRQL